MRQTIIAIFIFFFSFSTGQGQTQDSLKNLYIKGKDYFIKGKLDSAYYTYSKIIQLDSSYYKIYYLRAFCYLMDTEELLYTNKGVLRHNYGDSTLIEKAINDLKKCIQLYFIQPKVFPEDVICFDYLYKLPPKYIQLGIMYPMWELTYDEKNQHVIDGVLTYITSKDKNKKLACRCWKKALKEKVYKIDILINEFCK